MKQMKPCMTCHGKGWVFGESSILTGKTFYGLPEIKRGSVKCTCPKCFGRGKK